MARTLVLLAALLLAGCLGTPAGLQGPGGAPGPGSVACMERCAQLLDGTASRPWEPSVAADPTDPLHLLAGTTLWERDAAGLPRGWLQAEVSRDGGATWQASRIPAGLEAGPTHPLAAANSLGDAVVAFLPDGTALFAGLAYDHVGLTNSRAGSVAFARWAYSLFVARSHDGGLTWPETSVVARGQGVLALATAPQPVGLLGAELLWDANDKPWLAVGPDGTVLATWSELITLGPKDPLGGRADIVASVSRDGGVTWSVPAVVEQGGYFLGAAPVIAAGGWHVAYEDLLTQDMRLATSSDQGATWRSQAMGKASPFPAMAVQPLPSGGERLLLAYSDGSEGKTCPFYFECYRQAPTLRWSDDGAASWSAPVTLDEAAEPGRTVPEIAVDREGTAWLTFFHPTGEASTELRAAAFRDGRASAPVKLTSIGAASSDLGDYAGLAALPRGAFTVFVTSQDRVEFDLAGARVGPA